MKICGISIKNLLTSWKNNEMTIKFRVFRSVYALVLVAMLTLSASAQSLLSSSTVRSATVGLVVKDLDTDSLLIAYNYDKLLTPASVMKSVTTASAMLSLPADFKFGTKVLLTGKIKKNTLDGNIVVKASGDPTLESRHFPDNAGFVDSIAAFVKARGINEISGKIIVDYSVYDDGGVSQYWLLEDLPWDYGTGHFPLNYRDNAFVLTVGKGFSSKPNLDYIHVYNQLKKGKRNNASLTRADGSCDFYLKGTAAAPYATRTYNCANPDPSRLFISELKSKLKAEGIALGGDDKKTSKVAATYVHYSPLIDDIMHSLMVRSDNMFAEGMLRAQPLDSLEEASVEASALREIAMWDSLGVATESITIHDGSGLARTNKLTPRFETEMLTYMARSPFAERYVALFARAGVEGTLKSLLKDTPLQGKLALKSGSMRGVQCYAGYKIDENNRPTHIVVVMVNNFNGARANLKAAIGRFLLETFPTAESETSQYGKETNL